MTQMVQARKSTQVPRSNAVHFLPTRNTLDSSPLDECSRQSSRRAVSSRNFYTVQHLLPQYQSLHPNSCQSYSFGPMPPSKRTQDDPQSLKEKLHSLQGNGARGRRNGNGNAANGSNLKEVMSSNGDNASTNSGQNEHTSGVSGLAPTPQTYSHGSSKLTNCSL